jgi:hypothetical protein
MTTDPASLVIGIRSLKVQRRLSEETLCFSATIVVNGKAAGEATNRGSGGATDIHIKSPELREAAGAWAQAYYANPAADADPERRELAEGKGAAWCLELYIDYLVYAEDGRREAEKEAKKLKQIDAKNGALFAAKGFGWMVRLTGDGVIRWIPMREAAEQASVVAQTVAKHQIATVKEVVLLSTAPV